MRTLRDCDMITTQELPRCAVRDLVCFCELIDGYNQIFGYHQINWHHYTQWHHEGVASVDPGITVHGGITIRGISYNRHHRTRWHHWVVASVNPGIVLKWNRVKKKKWVKRIKPCWKRDTIVGRQWNRRIERIGDIKKEVSILHRGVFNLVILGEPRCTTFRSRALRT